MDSTQLIISPNDSRKYDVFTLDNGLEVTLINDNETKISGACLEIKIGWLDDPEEYQGLAHFLEHMLFMGSEKYPGQNDYNKFITQNAGIANASTFLQNTKYYFTLQNEGFLQGLDIFAQFFIAPLFDSSCIEREMNAVESEFNLSLADDSARVWEIFVSLAEKQSTFNRFGCGNLETLKQPGIRDALITFYNKYYSSHLMKLVVYTNQENVKPQVIETFSKVKRIHSQSIQHLDNPYQNNPKFVKVAGIKQEDVLHLSFMIKNYEKDYLCNPDSYIVHLLGHEGKNSLASFLKDEGLITTLICGKQKLNDGYSELSLELVLTEDGFEEYLRVAAYVFEYIKILKLKGINQELYQEWSDIEQIQFRFKEKTSVARCVISISANMHQYPREHILYGEHAGTQFNSQLINEVVDQLNEKNLIMLLRSNQFSNDNLGQIERFCKTKFEILPYKKYDEDLTSYHTTKKLDLIPLNKFVPKNFDLIECQWDKPIQIAPSVYYCKDNKFKICKMGIGLDIYPKQEFVVDPKQRLLIELWQSIFLACFEEINYLGECASIDFDISLQYNKVEFNFFGFSDSVPKFFEEFISYWQEFNKNPKQFVKQHIFEVLLDEVLDRIENYFLKSPYDLTYSYLKCMLYKKGKFMKEQLENIQLTYQEFLKFASSLFDQFTMKMYVHGNCSQDDAIRLSKLVTDFQQQQSEIIPLEVIKISENVKFDKILENEEEPNSGIIVYIQGEQSQEAIYKYNVLNQIISDPIEDQLRTNEQLGYVVYSNRSLNRGVYGLSITIISETKSPNALYERIDLFLTQFINNIKEITLEEFNNQKESLYQQKSQDYQNMKEYFKAYWHEIQINQFDYDLLQKLRQRIDSIDFNEFKEFAIDLLTKKPRLLINVINQKHQNNEILQTKKIESDSWYNDIYS